MTKKSLQTIILELQNFWAAHGCTIAQPYYTQVGAGTMNPATFLRVLGPEPWSVAYVEPSIRPDDGRYGAKPVNLEAFSQVRTKNFFSSFKREPRLEALGSLDLNQQPLIIFM